MSLLQSSKWNNAPWHQKYYGRIIVGLKWEKIAIMNDTKVALFLRWEEIWYQSIKLLRLVHGQPLCLKYKKNSLHFFPNLTLVWYVGEEGLEQGGGEKFILHPLSTYIVKALTSVQPTNSLCGCVGGKIWAKPLAMKWSKRIIFALTVLYGAHIWYLSI